MLQVKGSKRNYNWVMKASRSRDGYVRIVQDQGDPDGLQVVLLSPVQMTALRGYRGKDMS